MENFWSKTLLHLGEFPITGAQLALMFLILLGLLVLDWLVLFVFLPKLFGHFAVDSVRRRQVRRRFQPLFLYLLLLAFSQVTGIDYELHEDHRRWIGASTVIQALLIWQVARIADLILGRVILQGVLRVRESAKNTMLLGGTSGLQRAGKNSNRYIKYAAYVLTGLALLSLFQFDLTLFEGKIGKNIYALRLSNLLIGALVVLLAQLLIWGIDHFLLASFYRRRNINIGSQYAFNQLINYFIYFIAALIALHFVGVNITVIAGGAVALLVGVGIGLQQTFNDFFSGILLLFERSVEVGDWVELDGLEGRVRRIGPRTSVVQTRDNRSVIVPNSKLVLNNVTNWSHGDDIARFTVDVGVAYGSNTQLVKQILIEVAQNHPRVLANPEVIARLEQFADSSLNFQVYFWTDAFLEVDDIKSDIRLAIEQRFREANVTIPFPQSDVWLRNWEQKT
jgi:small-conductance mechanosensitive channel